ncbi:hypothetical protein LBMAG42_37410 [Deltaproteobacteria bacterium]|nr:hypothetical protein LBMAG42_37410 [Deltaproteobacteria bacterium]
MRLCATADARAPAGEHRHQPFQYSATPGGSWEPPKVELGGSADAEKHAQIDTVAAFHAKHAPEARAALARLRQVALDCGDLVDELMNTERVASLGQIRHALYEVGGEYRRTPNP